ncbi:AraC family transcriptional regulator [Variovorax sp. H27-G14]|uniref:AraC family transcriptional regulator n=1 Tax=Variovorax sp. H27-G14 TaxID=3111914 RepID=UPI0038FCA8A2
MFQQQPSPHSPPPRFPSPDPRGAEFEDDTLRDPEPGSAFAPANLVRCQAHGAPSAHERWHYHDDYELHLIVATHGKAYIGDDIASFAPGFLVLIGPRVPHNFVSTDLPAQGVALRSLAVQFKESTLRKATELFPELQGAMRFLERARHGIEFLNTGDDVRQRIHRMQALSGLARFADFAGLLNDLAHWPACRPLCATATAPNRTAQPRQIEKVLAHIHAHCAQELSLDSVSTLAGMSKGAFSRFFRRTTGHTFTEFVTRARIGEACQLLRDGRQQISSICYLVGFNNISNFNRHFRRLKGVTPGEYRNDTAYRRPVA